MSDKLQRALDALYLELPEAVARDFGTLVCAEIAALTKERDDERAKNVSVVRELVKAREERDAMKAALRDAYRIIEHARAIPFRDSAGLRITAVPAWEDFEASTRAALATESAAQGTE